MKTTLVILASSDTDLYDKRFYEPIGPNNELLLEYSLYDAIQAGFSKIVFIISDRIKEVIKAPIENKYGTSIEIRWVSVNPVSRIFLGKKIPYEAFTSSSYAIWKAKKHIKGPFLVINTKHFYGKGIFNKAMEFFRTGNNNFAILNFPLAQTLSPYGYVDRAICIKENNSDTLCQILEVEKIRKTNDVFEHDGAKELEVYDEMLASTGVFCLNETFFNGYKKPSKKQKKDSQKITISSIVNQLLNEKLAKAKVLTVESDWFSIEYKPERTLAKSKIKKLIADHFYPLNLKNPLNPELN